MVPAGILLLVGASFLGGAGPCLDAVRLDIVGPSIRGRAEAAKGLLTWVSSALGPLTFGLVATALTRAGAVSRPGASRHLLADAGPARCRRAAAAGGAGLLRQRTRPPRAAQDGP